MRELVQPGLWVLRLCILSGFLLFVLADYLRSSKAEHPFRLASRALAVWAGLNIAFISFLLVDHAGFPLNLDLMEGAVLQHLQRVTAGLPIYPDPTPAYTPLAYNPLFYVVTVPFTWILGSSHSGWSQFWGWRESVW
jgi:hypothetical protein